MKLNRWPLMDGEQRHAANPRTFLIPSKKRRESLQVGDWAKVGPEGERYWVEIIAVTGTQYTGIIRNRLVRSAGHGHYFGDKVQFAPCHVLDWGPPSPK